jgi:hypothetical protein
MVFYLNSTIGNPTLPSYAEFIHRRWDNPCVIARVKHLNRPISVEANGGFVMVGQVDDAEVIARPGNMRNVDRNVLGDW